MGTRPPGERYRSQASVPCPFPGGPVMTMRSPLSGFSITCGASGRPRDIALDTASREAASLPSSTGTFACTMDAPRDGLANACNWYRSIIATSPLSKISAGLLSMVVEGLSSVVRLAAAFGLRKRAYIPSRSYSWRRTRKAAGGGCP